MSTLGKTPEQDIQEQPAHGRLHEVTVPSKISDFHWQQIKA
jgi:hypothetical protein